MRAPTRLVMLSFSTDYGLETDCCSHGCRIGADGTDGTAVGASFVRRPCDSAPSRNALLGTVHGIQNRLFQSEAYRHGRKDAYLVRSRGGAGGAVRDALIEALRPFAARGHDLYFYDQIGSGHSV